MIGPLHSIFNLVELTNLEGLIDPASTVLRGNVLIDTEYRPTGSSLEAVRKRNGRRISVSDVANSVCPTKRDVYLLKVEKKIAKKYEKKAAKTIGMASDKMTTSWSGYFPDKFSTYSEIESVKSRIIKEVVAKNKSIFREMSNLDESALTEEEKSQTALIPKKWIIRVLETNLKEEIAFQKLYDSLGTFGKNKLLVEDDLKSKIKSAKQELNVLVSESSVPDFFIENVNIVGDVKTGLVLTKGHLLTVAGYALLLESLYKYQINWGAIYLITTRMVDSTNIFTTGQIYLIPINDELRKKFILARDEAYESLTRDSVPPLPKPEERMNICQRCNFNNHCWEGANAV